MKGSHQSIPQYAYILPSGIEINNDNMIQSGFIAAIDLGTSKITGVVGRKNDSGVISILACETIPSNNCIRRGLVYNIEETGARVRKLVNMLENKLNRKIGKVYVSLAGQSLHTVAFREIKQLSSSGIVTEQVIDQLRQAAEKYTPEMKKKYAIADVEYFIDDKPEQNPVGVTCSQIEAHFQMVVGRPNLLSNIEKSVSNKAQVKIVDYIVGPMASAAIVLSDEEKELGCAFIDFGGGTTTLSVYKGSILRWMAVIPFGGRSITKDICDLNFIESEAEQLKIKFGKAFEQKESSLFSSPFSSNKSDVDLTELNKVIRMRLDEITANIKEQIRLSGFQEQLGAGVIISGGASQLKNLDQYLSEKLKMPVRKASAKKTFINNFPELTNDPALTQPLGMLLFAKENCEEIVVEQSNDDDANGDHFQNQGKSHHNGKKETKKKPKPSKGFITKMGDVFSSMFSDEDDE